MARRSSQPKELVRLSPLQFSLSISVVVILLGGACLAGYYYGLKKAAMPTASVKAVQKDLPGDADSNPGMSETQTPVTFYSTLTKPRGNVPAAKVPEPVTSKKEKIQERSVPEPPSESSSRKQTYEGKGLLLQVASYQEEANAQKLLRDLSSVGYKGSVLRVDLGERGVWFRVRVGPYSTEKEARTVLEELRREKSLKGYIVK